MNDTIFADPADELALLGAELKAAGAIQNTTARAATVEYIKVAVLVDIAASLRILSSGIATVTPSEHGNAGEPDGPERTDDDPAPLDIGDWVLPIKQDEGDTLLPGLIESMGESEGSSWAIVGGWEDEDEQTSGRIWVSELVRVVMPDAPELPDDGDDFNSQDERQHLTDELDDDFEGEVKPLAKAERKALKAGKAPLVTAPKGGE